MTELETSERVEQADATQNTHVAGDGYPTSWITTHQPGSSLEDGRPQRNKDITETQKQTENTKPHSLSKSDLTFFEAKFGVSGENLEELTVRYRDGSIHFYNPDTNWFYTKSLFSGVWRYTDENLIGRFAGITGIRINMENNPSLTPDERKSRFTKLTEEDFQKSALENTPKDKCAHGLAKLIFYYTISGNTRTSRTMCEYCKENCFKKNGNLLWSEKKVHKKNVQCSDVVYSGEKVSSFQCYCGSCTVKW